MEYKLTVGLEIHVELETNSKMFCCSYNNLGLEKNANADICPICMGHPGTLPTINKEALEKVIQVGLALGCSISPYTYFERKNYFYPDLPKGYQISQSQNPLCNGGFMEIKTSKGAKKVNIARIHLEEDAGKLLHPAEKDYSLVDFNRASVPLMELVTEPDINSSEEAVEFAKNLQLILRYLEVSSADMENGQMRLEANISISKTNKLGAKVEVKNLNSFSILKKAIEYEYERQKEALDDGKKLVQETRGWDEKKQKTFSQRLKENSMDYRYFPDPDLPHLIIRVKPDQTLPDMPYTIDAIELKKSMPELPKEKLARFKKEYKLSDYDAELLIEDKDLSGLFEDTASELKELESNFKESNYKDIANFIIGDINKLINKTNASLSSSLMKPEYLAHAIYLWESKKISLDTARNMVEIIWNKGIDPETIMEENNFELIEDENMLEGIVKKVLSENKQAVNDFQSGKQNSFEFLVGQIMKQSKGLVKVETAREILNNLLKK